MTPRNPTAQALLDAQVAWFLDQLTGPALTDGIARDIDTLLGAVGPLRLADLVDRDQAAATARRYLILASESAMLEELATTLPGKIKAARQARRHDLAEVIAREDVDTLIASLLGLEHVHDKLSALLAESPLVGTLASSFVTRLVGDVIASNRERAERVPGVSSLLSFGTSAATKMRSVAERPVEALLGEASGRGGEYAVRRTTAALRDLADTGPVHDAAMEVWDVQASRPMADLYGFVTAAELRTLARAGHRLLATAGGSEYASTVVDACVEAVFDRYGDRQVGDLLALAGVSRDDLVEPVLRHAPQILRRLRDSGELERAVRERLEPFYDSASVAGILADAADPAPSPRSGANRARTGK